jgi:hypothetical protein
MWALNHLMFWSTRNEENWRHIYTVGE